ncbi:hypothetical protein [Actinomadura sp. 7K507]|uniref:hypothetical protein n=1 Tax=Actinomadura sp. 7K507 TaxID=2530365 RepID=UPI001FB77DBC|nr:hypothetical protein [Actinomadura sp. 7K507]
MSVEELRWAHAAFSSARMAPYLAASGGDLAQAMRLYWWNVEASAAFYGPLHCLEVTLRNALHTQLYGRHGRPDWWANARLTDEGRRSVEQARSKLRRRAMRDPSPDAIVAELTFGFWVSLLSHRADRHFWVPALHRAFPGYSGPRRELHAEMYEALQFRNRVMHHEPIHHRVLEKDHERVFRLLGHLSPECVVLARELDRIPEVLRRRDDVCAGRLRLSF